MMWLDGKSIAEEIKQELTKRLATIQPPPRLGIVVVGHNKASEMFVGLKEKFARDIGIETRRYEFEEGISTNALRERMRDIVHEARNDGVIMQLPLPSQIDTQAILNAITPEKDVDVLSARSVGNIQVGKSKILSPVAAAVESLFQKAGIDVEGKHAVVVGYGRLVGQPLTAWLIEKKALVTVMSDEKYFDKDIIQQADIIISGAGKPRLITGEMIQEGAVVVDVGTSEVEGVLAGDVDIESVAKKASYMTPAKGGIGPLTVAFVFKNLFILRGLMKSAIDI